MKFVKQIKALFRFNIFFLKIKPFLYNKEKLCKTRHATDDNTTKEHCILGT